MKFYESQTFNNLCASYTSEAHEGARYQLIAKMAQQQQLTALQATLKTLAKNEMSHAEQFFNLIRENIGDKTEYCDRVQLDATYNYCGGDLQTMLTDTAKIERNQQKVVYVNFAETARQEGFPKIAELFDQIAKIEGDHAALVTQILQQLKNGTLYKTTAKQAWKCSECGYEEENTAPPKTCPVCQTPQGGFYLKTDLARYLQR
jgi:rubrerythrin